MTDSNIIGRVGAVDYGQKRIGLAIGDTATGIAFPAGAIAGAQSRPPRPAEAAVKLDADAILEWARENAVAALVIGHPLNMDGSAGPQARLSERLVAELRRLAAGSNPPLRVELWDERLSSFQADEHLAAAGMKRGKRPGLRDALAAQVILQSYLDACREPPPQP